MGVEVDIYKGTSGNRKVGILKNDAKTLRHVRCRSGAFEREVKAFGDLITFDLVGASSDAENTGIIMGYPIGRKNATTLINKAYSDDINAWSGFKIPHDLSLPGKKQKTMLAERRNQFIVDHTTACLVHAGLPTCYWVYAISTLCHLINIEEIDGSSAWFRLRGEHFQGEKIPFGALVDFKPSDARREKREKFEPKGESGVFAGYDLGSGPESIEPGLSQTSLARASWLGRQRYHHDCVNHVKRRGSHCQTGEVQAEERDVRGDRRRSRFHWS